MRILSLIIISSLLLFSCNKFSKVLKSKDIEYKLKMADEYYNAKKYRYAEQLYLELFPVYKGTEKFEDLYYKYAYTAFYQKNFLDAENLFKGFLEVFPNSSKAEEVAYMHAYCFHLQSPKVELEQTNTTKAIGLMQTFINNYPTSVRVKEATDIIDKSRQKLEVKDYHNARLYYNLSQFRAAGIAFTNLLNSFPESAKGEDYKLMAIKSFYEFAKLSIQEKQIERFEKVVTEYNDYLDRFPESKMIKEAEGYSKSSLNYIKEIQNEQAKTS
ncbi:MAG: outer membrane protein assembly factor BamD, partial [Chitinophagaceae bacterium]